MVFIVSGAGEDRCEIALSLAAGEWITIRRPGRVIVGNAGIPVTRATTHNPRAAKTILVVDAAMNDLARPAMYEAYHEIWPVTEPGHTRPDLTPPRPARRQSMNVLSSAGRLTLVNPPSETNVPCRTELRAAVLEPGFTHRPCIHLHWGFTHQLTPPPGVHSPALHLQGSCLSR